MMVANIFLKKSAKVAWRYLKMVRSPKYSKDMASAIRKATAESKFSRSTLKKMARERISMGTYEHNLKMGSKDPTQAFGSGHRRINQTKIDRIKNKDWSSYLRKSKTRTTKPYREE